MSLSQTKERVIDIFNGSFERFVRSMIIISVVLFFTYIVLVGLITFSVVHRKTVEGQTKQLRSDIASLELSYLAQANTIDMAYVQTLGYTEVKNPTYTNRTEGLAMLVAHESL